MGRPLPGIEAAIVRRDEDGTVSAVDDSDTEGELALRPGWPSMFRGYLHEEERYHQCFANGWYLTGDLAKRDAEGYFWFMGRADDVIKSSGHLIGPFEVESALMEHPAVAEVGVIGKPDPVAGEIVKAFQPSEAIHLGVAISLRQGGLIAPAIHDVDKKTLDEIMRDLKDLVKRTRAGVLRSSEISDPTITVTSLGEQGVETVFGVIYPPQVSLVGFGKITQQPWAAEGMLGVRPVIQASLAADHRASDGHRGGRFLAAINRLLQEPEKL